jgi:hypothetical protein
MGILSKILAAQATTRIVRYLNEKGREPPPPRQQYIPARPALRDRAIDARNRAVSVYRENPKLVAGVGLIAAAMVLQQLSRRR